MISKWRVDYTDEEKGMALTIQSQKQEIEKLVDELEEQERHIAEANVEIEKLHSIIKEVREEIEYFDLQAKHLDDNIYLDERLTNKLLEILDKER